MTGKMVYREVKTQVQNWQQLENSPTEEMRNSAQLEQITLKPQLQADHLAANMVHPKGALT